MSRIDDLIREYCPEGVEYRPLGDVLRYEQPGGYLVASTAYDDSFRTPVLTAGQTFVLGYTAETDGIYPASTGEPVVIFDDFTAASKWVDFPFKAKSSAMKMLTSRDADAVSLKFAFQSIQTIRYEPHDHARQWIGTYSRFRIPWPPLEVRREIVRMLDLFTELDAQLSAELEARRRQYAYYRDALLAFRDAGGVRWVPMGEFGTIFGGLTGKSKAAFSDGNARYVAYTNVFNNLSVDIQANNYVRVDNSERQRALQRGDILFTGSSETAEDVAMSSAVTDDVREPLYLNSFCIGYRPTDPALLDPDFAKHLFRSSGMREQLVRTASGVTRFNVSKARLARVEIPIPDIFQQRHIAVLLDTLHELVSDLNTGLPAELAARRRQYEHYRDRLLTFREAA